MRALAIFVIVFVVLVMGLSSFSPAMAAKKISEDRGVDEFNGKTKACGGTVQIVGVDIFHITRWDNGKLVSHSSLHAKLFDLDTGEKVGTISDVFNFVTNTDSLPRIVQSNFKVTCDSDGQTRNVHSGFTIDENGKRHFH